ncbi:MAG: flagellar hook-basal body protein [Firmicutes bacterium]|jgi:flagellar basal-body rod protein FlgG|nr:flagellar hook-basal body protein [Bacillota bacterium]
MFRGLYTAGSALVNNNRRIDVVSNNIANANTSGYKKDELITESFEDTLISKIHGQYYATMEKDYKGVEVTQVEDRYLLETDGGFFKVRTGLGDSFDKNLNLSVDKDGYLSTYSVDMKGDTDTLYGNEVIGRSGNKVYVGEKPYEIDKLGNVIVDGETVDNLIIKEHKSVIGTMNAGVRINRIETNFSQGQLLPTNNMLDFALKGDGFFKISTPDGMRYTRNGSFKIDANNTLVTNEGYKVQGFDGDITIEGSLVSINQFGEILVDGQVADKFDVVKFENPRDLRKVGESMWRPVEDKELEVVNFDGEIIQGHIENSNVDTIKEMINMMTLFRNYESNQKIIKAYDETMDKSVNSIGKV